MALTHFIAFFRGEMMTNPGTLEVLSYGQVLRQEWAVAARSHVFGMFLVWLQTWSPQIRKELLDWWPQGRNSWLYYINMDMY